MSREVKISLQLLVSVKDFSYCRLLILLSSRENWGKEIENRGQTMRRM